jgi:hypothetical protein
MELYLRANSNVISMNSLNTIIVNAMEKSKLGEADFDEHDLFSSPALEEKICLQQLNPIGSLKKNSVLHKKFGQSSK